MLPWVVLANGLLTGRVDRHLLYTVYRLTNRITENATIHLNAKLCQCACSLVLYKEWADLVKVVLIRNSLRFLHIEDIVVPPVQVSSIRDYP